MPDEELHKVIIIGNRRVRKTSIINRYANNMLKQQKKHSKNFNKFLTFCVFLNNEKTLRILKNNFFFF